MAFCSNCGSRLLEKAPYNPEYVTENLFASTTATPVNLIHHH